MHDDRLLILVSAVIPALLGQGDRLAARTILTDAAHDAAG